MIPHPLLRKGWGTHASMSYVGRGGPALHSAIRRMARIRILFLLCCPLFAGCVRPEPVEVDLSARPVRFVINHTGWPRPFWWPRVTEFAVATGCDDEGELLWHLKSSSAAGELAHYLAFIYGRVPPGFHQVAPESGRVAKPLERGRTYFVAAEGKGALYRMVFSLPVESNELVHPRVTIVD